MASTLNLDALVARQPRVHGIGLVKNVISGDTIIVVGSAKNGPAVEKRLTLTNITSPRLSQTKDEKDEPFAYQAREYLRERVLGKVVQFLLPGASVDGATNPTESSKPDFADVTFNNTNLSELMVRSGFATVVLPKTKENKDGKEIRISSEKQALLKHEAEAKSAKVGMFANNAKSLRKIIIADGAANVELFKKYVGKEIPAYVDYVINGSTLRVEIKTNPKDFEHTMTTFNLAGLECPQPPSKAKAARNENDKARDALPGEPFGAEARQYVVERLGGQDVKIVIQAIDNDQRLYGTVVFSKGNISKHLLQDGLARYVAWSGLATANKTELQLAASQAKTNIAATSPYVEEQRVQYEATVVQINSGDAVTIRTSDDGEKRVYLASIKAPRFGKKIGDKAEDYAFESREFLRRSLIGKKVMVQTEYTLQEKKARDTNNNNNNNNNKDDDKKEEVVKVREYVSMFKGKFNIAAELLANGLADIVPTPRDAPRSLYLAELCSASIKAQTEKKHKWATGKVPLQLIDLTPRVGTSKEANIANKDNEERVEYHFKKLQNSSVAAVLDAVYSPTRFRVFVPTLNTFFAVRLAALNVPAFEKDNVVNNTLNEQTMAQLKRHLQHDITLEVTHKVGLTLVANIINRDSKENLGLNIVQNGQATLIMGAVEKNKYSKEFIAAQENAKKSRLGVWADYDEQKEKEELERQKQEAADTIGSTIITRDGDNYINVTVTDVHDPIHFYVNNSDDKLVKEIHDKMNAFEPTTVPDDYEPKQGEIVAALFDEDNKWYRARIEKASKSRGKYQIQFIDFGNLALVPYGSLCPLPTDLQKLRQAARPCALSGLLPPQTVSEWYNVGAEALSNLTMSKTFNARIDYTERHNGVLHLTLIEDGQKSVNARLLEEGLLLLNQRPISPSLQRVFAELEEYEQFAHDKHNGLFEYGDYVVDDRD